MENLAKIGIDFWSIVLYIINYGLLLIVLSYFLYPKLRSVIKNRKQTIKQNLEDAEVLRKKLEEYTKISEQEKAKLVQEVHSQREEAKKELKIAREQLTSEMEEKRNKMLDDARRIISEKKDLIISEAQEDILNIIKSVMLDVLKNDVSEEVIEKSIRNAWDKNKGNK